MVACSLTAHTLAEVRAEARTRLPAGASAAATIYRAALRSAIFPPPGTGLSAANLAEWERSFALHVPAICDRRVETIASSTGGATEKLILQTADGLRYETVRIPMGRGRESQCLSSQVGCAQACRFCETARMGLRRNLEVDEIVGQVLAGKASGWSPRSLVFMGMGEALDNHDNVLQALRVLMDPGGLGFSQQRLTVCTVGHVDGIRRLAAAKLPRLNLSFSLNATNDEARAELMPITRRFRLDAVQAALAEYRQRNNFQLGINYCLMPGINDGADEPRRIADFCRPLGRVMVYLIGYNPGSRPLTRSPTDAEMERFVAALRTAGLPVRRRVTKGKDLMAACGQLGEPRLRQPTTAPTDARQ